MLSRNRTAIPGNGARVDPWTALLLTMLVGCSSLEVQSTNVPILVSNATCAAGPCRAIRVLAFPLNQPRTPGGSWSIELGTLATSSACFAIPPESKFLIVDATAHDTVVVRWTSRDSVALGTLAPEESRLQASPSTGYFVPQHERGWGVELPGSLDPHPAGLCSPQAGPP
jgi:hypothetical protein